MAEQTVERAARGQSATGGLRLALGAYLELLKPASIALLVFVGLASFVVASSGQQAGWPLVVVVVAGIAGSGGANAVSSYLDRDVDAIMSRTRRRPLPSGRLAPQAALVLGLGLMALALVLAATLGVLAFALMLAGELDYVLVYSLLAKRRSRWSVLWGAFSGGAPVVFGWVAATGRLAVAPILMAALVVLWIPSHIWTLAIFHADDYRRARVPMLPAVVDLRSASRCLACTSVLALIASLALAPVGAFGGLYLSVAVPAGLVLAGGNVALALHPTRERAWVLFKLSSPYLLLVFLAMALERVAG